ncbi:MAG: methionine synthase [Clostridia bacterium]|nr:methionine synthase [Clostridia bacterium]
MPLNIREALRYLGVTGEPDDALLQQAQQLSAELTSRIIPHYSWRMLPLEHSGGQLTLAGRPLPGHSAARMLDDCHQCALLICTLGAAFDLWLRQMQARDMVRAALLDALGSAYVEAACDSATEEIAARFPDMYLTDRFSPGYGDLPLTLQPALLELAGARRIGLTCTPSLLLAPQKSVTALIGLAEQPQMARIRGCQHCRMNNTCTFRKAGTTCAI